MQPVSRTVVTEHYAASASDEGASDVPLWMKAAGLVVVVAGGFVVWKWHQRRQQDEATRSLASATSAAGVSDGSSVGQKGEKESASLPRASVLDSLSAVTSVGAAGQLLGKCEHDKALLESASREATKGVVNHLFAAATEQQITSLIAGLGGDSVKWGAALDGLEANKNIKPDAIAPLIRDKLAAVPNWLGLCGSANLVAQSAWTGQESALRLVNSIWALPEPTKKAASLAALYCNANDQQQYDLLLALASKAEIEGALVMGVVGRVRLSKQSSKPLGALKGICDRDSAIVAGLSVGDMLAYHLTYKAAFRESDTFRRALLDKMEKCVSPDSNKLFPFALHYMTKLTLTGEEVRHVGTIAGNKPACVSLLDYYVRTHESDQCIAFLEGIANFPFNQIGRYLDVLDQFETLRELDPGQKARCGAALEKAVNKTDALKGIETGRVVPKLTNLFHNWECALPGVLKQ